MKVCCVISILCALLSISKTALAHREDYIDETLVYVTLEKGETEPEYWFDFGRKPDKSEEANPGSKENFIRHSLALEHGITDQWMIDGRVTLEDPQHESSKFESGRFETRYRFFEEGEKLVDTAVSLEINTERDEKGHLETGIEPRLILSKDYGALNFTLNLPVEIVFDSGKTTFIPSFGVRDNVNGLLRLGSEFRYNTDNHEGAIIPQIWFALPREITIKLGYSFGFDRNEEDFARIAVEVAI